MRITSQNGRVYITNTVNYCGNVVYCMPQNNMGQMEILGVYENKKRAARIVTEIYYAIKKGKSKFVMPQKLKYPGE